MIGLGLKNYWKNNKRNSLRWKLKNLKWELKYAWQRAWYGYDSIDIIEMNTMFIERYKAILKEYKKYHCGLFNVPDEYREFNKLHFNDEETDVIIDMMIYHLEMMNEDHVEKILYGKNIYDDDYEIAENMVKRYKRIYSVMNQNKEAFMKLFNLFFWGLWD